MGVATRPRRRYVAATSDRIVVREDAVVVLEVLSVVAVGGFFVGQGVRNYAVLVEQLALIVEDVLRVLVLSLCVEGGLPDLARVVVVCGVGPAAAVAPVVAIPVGEGPLFPVVVHVAAVIALAHSPRTVDVVEAVPLAGLVLVGAAQLVDEIEVAVESGAARLVADRGLAGAPLGRTRELIGSQ